MKKVITSLLIILLVLSFAACGTDEKTDNPGTDPIEKTSAPEGENINADNENPFEQYGLNLPKNVKISIQAGPTYYKIGNDIMQYSQYGNNHHFYHYIGGGEFEVYYWSDNEFVKASSTTDFDTDEFGKHNLKEYLDDGFVKAEGSKELFGFNCSKYQKNDYGKTFAYIDEVTGLVFEYWFSEESITAAYAIRDWDTSITEFPIESPLEKKDPVEKPDIDYDFEEIGLSDSICKTFEVIEEKYGPGAYYASLLSDFDPSRDDVVYICKNGDKVLVLADSGTVIVFSVNEGYIEYTFDYHDGCYSIVEFVDNKFEYYTQEYLIIAKYFLYESMVGTVPNISAPNDYHEITEAYNKSLLGTFDEVPAEGSPTALWLKSYKRYANDKMTERLNTQYMPLRNISYLDPVKDKIYSWEITYSVPDYYNTDYILQVEFTKDITESDMDGIAGRVENMTGQELPGMMGIHEGSIIFYTCVEGENRDDLSDYYEIIYLGGIYEELNMKSYIKVTFLNRHWVDGGSFCTYKLKKDGLHRVKNIEPYTESILVKAK